jgi:erythromycin esterase
MKSISNILTALALIASYVFTSLNGFANNTNPNSKDSLKIAEDLKNTVELNLDDYQKFKKAIMPLIDEIGSKKVVALGEGTHGTSEFYKVRYWITKILVEEKGFNHVVFENDYSDSYVLNQQLSQGNTDYRKLMKENLISIWQNKETEELLKWIQKNNKKNKQRVDFGGVDNVFLEADVKALKMMLKRYKNEEVMTMLDELQQRSAFQDSIWKNQNVKDFTYNADQVNDNGLKAFKIICKIEEELKKGQLPSTLKEECIGFLMNNKQNFDTFYQWVTNKRGSSRDSSMAVMTSWIGRKQEDKVILWAHNAHVARIGVYGGAVGGTGGFLERMFPGQYFVIGTGTSTGTFLATKDNFDTRENIMTPYPLEPAIEGSWEKALESKNQTAFYFNTNQLIHKPNNLVHRHVGYTPNSGKNSYDQTNLLQMYDGFIFIGKTKAAEFIK